MNKTNGLGPMVLDGSVMRVLASGVGGEGSKLQRGVVETDDLRKQQNRI